ncbi:MAG: membrane protein insertase YidC [Verrucomicrobiota bacterium]
MDRKAIIILVVSLLLWFGLVQMANKLYPPKPAPPKPTNSVAGATNVIGSGVTNATGTTARASAPTTPVAAPVLPRPSAGEQLLTYTNTNARYTFTSHGGGLKFAELLKYPAVVNCRDKNGTNTNDVVSLNRKAPVPALTLLGAGVLEGDGLFVLSRTANGVRAEKVLTNNLYLVKEFTPGSNYLLHTTVRLENRSSEPVRLPQHEWVIGAATPLGFEDESLYVGLIWYDGQRTDKVGASWFANKTLGCFPGTPRAEHIATGTNFVWAATHNQFFTVAVIPKEPAPQLVARSVPLPSPTRAEKEQHPKALDKQEGYQGAFVYPEQTLAPGQALVREYEVYAGPKEYNVLAKLGTQFNNNLDLIMEYGGFFGFFSKALLLSMNALHNLGLSYGWAIIVITIIIKLLFWPLTNASTKSMKRMALLGPKMKEIQDKYKEDPQKMNQKMMEFMRENKVNPLGGCLPMLVQMPVFFGFFFMIRSAIELRAAEFLWICDLSSPDTLFVIPGLGLPFNLMPLLMGVTMLWQAHLTPPSPGMDPMQQKIMKYMPLMFLGILYNFSSGLTLYWTVQNLLTIAQTKLTKTDPAPGKGAPAPAPSPKVPIAPKKKRK